MAYEAGNGFIGNRYPWVRLIYESDRRLASAALLLCLILIAGSFVHAWRGRWPSRGAGVFLLLSLLLGPGLMVNLGLKEHWGRARPTQTADFGGPKIFTPALKPAANCQNNCSFVSGHASVGFWWLALGLAWPAWRMRAMALGLGLGGLFGLARILQGGHFASDVIFSLLVVWGMAELLAWVFRSQAWLPPPQDKQSASFAS
ncbi:MAG: phosphatase PAP2 family protein [Sulfuricella sp.]